MMHGAEADRLALVVIACWQPQSLISHRWEAALTVGFCLNREQAVTLMQEILLCTSRCFDAFGISEPRQGKNSANGFTLHIRGTISQDCKYKIEEFAATNGLKIKQEDGLVIYEQGSERIEGVIT